MSRAQNTAADPRTTAFLTANAGSGKTSTLVNRVARLLLNGARPERILCVTYTKAAAAEMQGRLFERLGRWAIASDEDLARDLAGIDEPTHDLARARALFARALETPGGLKIQTLHAFCEKLLRRFPLEAGLSPSFQVLDDLVGQDLAEGAKADLLTVTHPDIAVCRDQLIRTLKISGFEKLLGQFVMQHDDIYEAFATLSAYDDWQDRLFQSLGLEGVCTSQTCLDAYEAQLEWQIIHDLAAAMSIGSTSTNQNAGAQFLAVIEARNAGKPFDHTPLVEVFFTKTGSPRKSPYTKETSPGHAIEMDRLFARVAALVEQLKAAEIAENTLNALRLFAAFSGFYQTRKQAEGALDFHDLIAKTRDLLSDRSMSIWVLFKLDGGLEHVLVDEAQDTSDDQWSIVKALTAEFFSGAGQHADRTVFAVGDEKQSIYGFQGAEPDLFLSSGQYYERVTREAGAKFVAPDLLESWRTLPEILGFVDAVFPAPDLSEALNFTGNVIRHEPQRRKHQGLVELWPPVRTVDTPDQSADDDDDIAPVDQVRGTASKRLAQNIAATIQAEIAAGRSVYSKGSEEPRPMHAGDVLILVRKRDALFEHIIRELKMAGVPVSGADRLKLDEHIAFQDLRALLRFCLQQADDLSLACLLRSPFCDLSEDDLYTLAQPRERSLWGALLARDEADGRFAEARIFLLWAVDTARQMTAFDFLARALNRRDPAGRSFKQRFLTRLGDECEDVLDETLALALKGEAAGHPGLSACLNLFEFHAQQIKREQEEGGRSVRVMTVHGSKGLEAPWVILPVAPNYGAGNKGDLLLTSEEGALYLAIGGKSGDVEATAAIRTAKADRDDKESLRLLYVALTRARDRLTLCGYSGARAAPAGAYPGWHELMSDAFDRLPDVAVERLMPTAPFDDTDEPVEIRLYGARSPTLAAEARIAPAETVLPGFATTPVLQTDVDHERWAAISQMGDEDREADDKAPSPLESRNGLGRYRRGNLIHKLFEILPEVSPSARADVAARYLGREPDLNDAQRSEMATAVLTVLSDDRFAEAFGPQSKPEVALAGEIGTDSRGLPLMLSGRIDRLVVTEDRVLIIDYKSNRPAPQTAEGAAIAYQRQMAGYVALLRKIYPQKTVESALLWTDGPRLTPLSEALVNLRLGEILSR